MLGHIYCPSLNHKVFDCTLGVIGNLSMNRGAAHCFCNMWKYTGEVIEY
jgi:hypothetical protein